MPDDEDEPLLRVGVAVVLFNPAHPHCTQCDKHLDPEQVDQVILVALKHRNTGMPGLGMLCLDCALKNDEIRPHVLSNPDLTLGNPDRPN